MTRMPLSLLPSVIDLATDWWDDINESQRWQDGIFYALCASYALVSSVALRQPQTATTHDYQQTRSVK
ncbi:hypothetical protein RHGRI_037281 [Rhododendron griersonianum]|uniref:THH1/TOM1/TOM3 domain-containing protein n=1 Tax=Rhododendron griersonianum TaxID=479676 RepID=A0AAV6HR52_9ERIC|nr:hypothetical protein RHGRI_037281 [Rhododendron griersonianum]